ncbi:hypothetical protein ROT00_06455 [Agromyces mediolanus]|uniref:type 1 glutamine amidotransferase n=1 Tax=Agromyces mediolanus TaxID=41986 RepID=UPI00383442A7
MTFTIVSLLPGTQNTNGDAQNATVLERRAEWAGIAARTVSVERAAELPGEVDAVVLGSGSDASLERSRDVLRTMHEELRRWGTEGVPILGIGTGLELLGWGVEHRDGSSLEGLGILPGRAVPRDGRVTGDVVVASPRFGRLVGFENHARDYVGAEGSPLGRLRAGAGNGRDSGQEGVVMGSVIGTHLHGPVLAKNPAFADALLRIMAERRGLAYEPGEAAAAIDAYAAAARQAQLRAAGIELAPEA